MNWINTDWRFTDRRAMLTIPYDCVVGRKVSRAINPEALEAFLRPTILQERPELAGCVIFAIRLNFEHMRYEVGVSHESLPPVQFGDVCTIMPLLLTDSAAAPTDQEPSSTHPPLP